MKRVTAAVAVALLTPALLFAAQFVTKRGDTLQSVAQANNMTVAQLATLNPNLKLTSYQTVIVSTPIAPPVTPPVAPSQGALQVYTTFYASGDNTPAGSTQIDLGGHSGNAGGTGTYQDPITLAVGGSIINGQEIDDYPYGMMFYFPDLKKYFIAEDFCGDGNSPQTKACHKSEVPGYVQLDLYAGNGNLESCEDRLTGIRSVVFNPASNLQVDTSPICK